MGNKQKRSGVLFGMVVMVVAPVVFGETVTLEPVKDNTLYENPAGSISNGAGQNMFVGRNSAPMNSRRRGVIAFDVAGHIPAGSVIDGVTLMMSASRNSSGATVVTVHRLLTDWGEGTSDAGEPGGQGAPATEEDATWLHSFYDTDTWTAPGGDFDPAPSASAAFVGLGPVLWSSTPGLVGDAQTWLDSSGENFGWILIGDESDAGTAARFSTRENSTAEDRPQLIVEFTPLVAAVPAVSQWGVVVLFCLLATAARIRNGASRRTRSAASDSHSGTFPS